MRRSLRDSIVGFSLLGGILVFTFFYFWIRGVKLSSKNWHLYAEFNNASGLAKKSPVTYRGILVGSVEDILFTNESIKAKKVNIKIPPNKENPTIESRKLLRIIFKCLLVALGH